jgi:hypothetical protein
MPTSNQTPDEVKKVCDRLECSPSAHDESGYQGGHPNIVPTEKSSESATGGTHLHTHTTEFQMADRGRPLPNYQKKFAKKPQTI